MRLARVKVAKAVTLIEVIVAMVALAVTAMGALGYQYHAAVQARIAYAQTTSTRAAQLLLEDWKSTGGSSNYDPTALGLGFSADLPLPANDHAPLPDGIYSIMADNVPLLVMLNSADVDHDDTTGVTLRQLTVTVGWRRDPSKNVETYLGKIVSAQIVSAQAVPAQISEGIVELKDILRTSVSMTTYVRLDASGG